MDSNLNNIGISPKKRVSVSEPNCDLEFFVTAFACAEAAEGDKVISSLVSQSIVKKDLEQATFWQRVRFQARLARAIPGWEKRGQYESFKK